MVGSRKRSSAKNRLVSSSTRSSGKDKVSDARKYGEALVGSRIRVWWPMDSKFYKGVVDSYVSSKKKHRVFYEDGDKETLDLKKERWELIEEDDAESESDEISLQEESAGESSEGTPEPPKGKGKASLKGRTDEAMPKKKQKIDSSSKSKAKEVEKKASKPETEKNGKMGDIGGKIVAAASRMSERFRSKGNVDQKETLKASKKPKMSSKLTKRKHTDDQDEDEEAGDDIDTSSEEAKPKVLKSCNSNADEVAENSSDEDEPKVLKTNNSKADKDEDEEENETSDDEAEPKALKLSNSNSDNGENNSSDDEKEITISKITSKKIKSNTADEENGDNEDGEKAVDEMSDGEPLVSFLKKSPEGIDAKRKKMKGKKEEEEEEGEENAGKDTKAEEASS